MKYELIITFVSGKQLIVFQDFKDDETAKEDIKRMIRVNKDSNYSVMPIQFENTIVADSNILYISFKKVEPVRECSTEPSHTCCSKKD